MTLQSFINIQNKTLRGLKTQNKKKLRRLIQMMKYRGKKTTKQSQLRRSRRRKLIRNMTLRIGLTLEDGKHNTSSTSFLTGGQ